MGGSQIERKEYLETRNWYAERIFHASDTFDKTIITLSTSILGASLLFINNKKEIIGGNIHLILSWIFLALTILINLLSFLLSEITNRRALERYDAEYQQKTERELALYDCKIAIESKIILTIKICAILFLILWVSYLIAFFYFNIPVSNG